MGASFHCLWGVERGQEEWLVQIDDTKRQNLHGSKHENENPFIEKYLDDKRLSTDVFQP